MPGRPSRTFSAVLELAELESSAKQLRPDHLDVVHAVRHIVATFQESAQARGLYLKFDCAVTECTAMIDKDGLVRVLRKLLSNALKFTHEGGVTVRLACVDDIVQLDVIDTGIGIGDAFRPRLFDDFQQESDGLTRKYEGIGLGLSIAKRLVEIMGGRIAVASEQDAGSTFTVRLPQANGEKNAAPTDARFSSVA